MADEQNQNIKNDFDEIKKCQLERDEYLNNWKRERADFLNYKKDEAKRLEEFIKFANESVILEVIEVLDDLERAAKEINDEGLNRVLDKFQEFLKKYGVEKIKVEGAFDPLLHEAVIAETNHRNAEGAEAAENEKTYNFGNAEETENIENKEEKIEEVRAGYIMYGRVIRPTRVKIVKQQI